MDVFDRIRQGCERVAVQSRHVRLVRDRIPEFARGLGSTSIQPLALDTKHHFVAPAGEEAATTAFFVTLDAVNFGSGYFPFLRKRPGCSGYFTVASALTDWFHARGPIPASELAASTPEDCAKIFEQDLAIPEIAELMSLFAEAWRDLGQDLLERFDGQFAQLIEAADQSAARLVGLLDRQAFFRDVADYNGDRIPIYKRAQILSSDLALALNGQGLGQFDDLDRLTIFADNLVPHVLRVEGVLTYDPGLLARIESGERLLSGSPEEVEIRACAVHAVELISASLRSLGRPTTSRNLDLLLWNRGQDPRIKGAGPRHRTRCVYY